jgi:hypothetical protein
MVDGYDRSRRQAACRQPNRFKRLIAFLRRRWEQTVLSSSRVAAKRLSQEPPFCSKMGRDRIAVHGGPSHGIQSSEAR